MENKNPTTFIALMAAALVMTLSSAHAAVIAEYTFEAGNGVSTDGEALTAAGVYSMAFYPGDGNDVAEFTNAFDSLSLGSFAATISVTADTDPTLADALGTADFDNRTSLHRFTITIPSGVTLSIDSLDFDWGFAQSGSPTTSTAPKLDLVSTATGGTILETDNFTIDANEDPDIFNADSAGALKGYNTDLSGYASLQNLSDTTVTFLFALDEHSREATTRRHVIDNVILIGSVAVIPEPSSLVLMGLSLLALTVLRRKSIS